MEAKERNIERPACMGNPHITASDSSALRNEDEVREWLAKNLRITVIDDYIIRDGKKLKEQFERAEQIIYDGLPKIKRE